MSNNGWLYLMINPSMDGIVKIGKTKRDPDDRLKELSSATGVPTPFVLIYKAYYNNCDKAEEYVHTILDKYRISNNREFFAIDTHVGIDIMIGAKGTLNANEDCTLLNNQSIVHDQSHNDIYELAEKYYYGLGDKLQDYNDALKHYIKAYKLGSPMACLMLGTIYTKKEYYDKQKAISYYKEGCNRGVAECYAELAHIYLINKEIDNTIKCWYNYFENELHEPSESEIGNYVTLYISHVKSKLIPCYHLTDIQNSKDIVFNYYFKMLDMYKKDNVNTKSILARIDFASYLLNKSFMTGTRKHAHVTYWDDVNNIGYATCDDYVEYTISSNELIDENDIISAGAYIEFNHVISEEDKNKYDMADVVKVI